MRNAFRLAALLGILTAITPASGVELWRSGQRSVSWSGSIRELLTVSNGTDGTKFREAVALAGPSCVLAELFADCPAFELVGDRDVWQGLTRLRQRLDIEAGGGWSGTFVYDHELRVGILDRFGLGSGGPPDTFLGLEDEIHAFGFKEDASHRQWRHLMYRAFVRYEGEHLEVTAGRQRIPWGVGRLWNPIDRFNAIGPLAIEADQSVGIDALKARWLLSDFDSLQLVYAPGSRSDDARYALRFEGVLRDTDVGLMAGVFEQARTFGGDLAGNLGDAAWRVEAVYTDPERDVWEIGWAAPRELDRFWQVVVSLDYNFDVGNGVYFLVEHLYDGNALGFGEGEAGTMLPLFEATPGALGPMVRPVSASRFGGSGVVSYARHTTGLQLSSDLTSVVNGSLLVLYDWNGPSVALFPALSFTGLNTVEITLGAQLFAGSARSQYGDAQALAYLLVEYFF
ncbi:MAG: hypothetical protein GY723_22665 [bacterium]|nr:hypothetical protein [bacterium]MCP5070077.1 hypothetical protein [bacterium]